MDGATASAPSTFNHDFTSWTTYPQEDQRYRPVEHATDDFRNPGVDDQDLEPLRGLGHHLGPIDIEQVMELIQYDQLDAAVFQQFDTFACRLLTPPAAIGESGTSLHGDEHRGGEEYGMGDSVSGYESAMGGLQADKLHGGGERGWVMAFLVVNPPWADSTLARHGGSATKQRGVEGRVGRGRLPGHGRARFCRVRPRRIHNQTAYRETPSSRHYPARRAQQL